MTFVSWIVYFSFFLGSVTCSPIQLSCVVVGGGGPAARGCGGVCSRGSWRSGGGGDGCLGGVAVSLAAFMLGGGGGGGRMA